MSELTRWELRAARTAARMNDGHAVPRFVFYALILLPGCVYAVAAVRGGEEARFQAAMAGMALGIAGTSLLDYPMHRALGKLYARSSGTAPLGAPPATPPAAPASTSRSEVRNLFLVLVVAGAVTIAVAFWRIGAGLEVPWWGGVAMGATGGLTLGVGIFGAALPRWGRFLASLEDRSQA